MSLKSDWKRADWVQKSILILLILILPLLIIIAADNWHRHYKQSNSTISTKTTGQAKQQQLLLESIKP
jgi:hypothetical protein